MGFYGILRVLAIFVLNVCIFFLFCVYLILLNILFDFTEFKCTYHCTEVFY